MTWIALAIALSMSATGTTTGRQATGGPPTPTPTRSISVHCPHAYVGVQTALLPSGWRGTSSHVEAVLDGSTIQGGWLRCTYRVAGGNGAFRVQRAAPYGYDCRVKRRGAFSCRRQDAGRGVGNAAGPRAHVRESVHGNEYWGRGG